MFFTQFSTSRFRRSREAFRFAVNRVANDGMADNVQMDPDLVGPARLDGDIQKRHDTETLPDLPVRHRRLAAAALRRHHLPFDGMPSDGQIDHARLLNDIAVDDGPDSSFSQSAA